MKTTISEEKKILDEHSSVLDTAEEKISEVGNVEKETTQNETQSKKQTNTQRNKKRLAKKMNGASLKCGATLNSLQYV